MAPAHLTRASALLLGLCSLAAAVSYRLPLEVVPYSYSLQLVPYLDEGNSSRQFTFDGNVSILVRAQRPESSITLHVADIQVLSSEVVQLSSGAAVTVAEITTDQERDFLVVHLAAPLVQGDEYRLSLSYTGNMREYNDRGVFRTYYYIGDEKRWLAGTQFEPLGARRAFPCFDEPALKATFNVSIARLPHMNSISNMPLLKTEGPDATLNGRYWDIFDTSVEMSTYLVAFVVSDFEALESGMYRVWSKHSTLQMAQFAMNITSPAMSIMENLTGIPFTLPKLDQVAVPLYGGGMENWGLVLYGETYLLLNLTNQMWNIAQIVSHELSHQWFGDLVTFNWWKYTWLNEGFATFFQYFVTDKMFPEWEMTSILVEYEQFPIMDQDSDGTSHPLSADVEKPAEVSMMFDSVTYSKGGSVLKMLAHCLTFETFYKGLNIYLKARAFSGADADDLFAGLQQAVDEDGVLSGGPTVKAIMDTWTLQSDYPVVTVTRNYSAGTATVQQEQFFSESQVQPSNSSWFVPLTYTTSTELQFNSTRPSLWLAPDQDLTVQDLPGEDQWVIFNIQAMGYFRVNYDKQNWKLLTNQLNTDQSKIHQLNRVQIHEDSIYFLKAGLLDWGTVMGITSYLRKETDPLPWMSAFRGLQWFFDKLGGSPVFPALKTYYLKLIGNVYDAVGFEARSDDSYMVSRVRPELLHWACLLGHEDCTESSVRNVARMRTMESHRVESRVRGTQYCAAVRRGGLASWEWLWSVYQNTDDVTERQEALRALGCTTDVKLLNRLLYLTVTEDSGLKPQDRHNVFSAACNGQDAVSCDTTLKFISSHFTQLANLFGEYESISSILVRVASRLRTQEQVDMLQFIINKNRDTLSADEHLTSMALKMARNNADWVKTEGAGLVDWLSRHHSI